ncbi:hypothetical protein EYF80_012369 [Liparis tanakae]|uniref:Uncharacterized protein n=1 Tax=Liparis tanakae TaxID=230148 RepID=A0A4Z2II83_9TELE|nr:hypothetical protein EYF80_012369 [Liparis tanakae]
MTTDEVNTGMNLHTAFYLLWQRMSGRESLPDAEHLVREQGGHDSLELLGAGYSLLSPHRWSGRRALLPALNKDVYKLIPLGARCAMHILGTSGCLRESSVLKGASQQTAVRLQQCIPSNLPVNGENNKGGSFPEALIPHCSEDDPLVTTSMSTLWQSLKATVLIPVNTFRAKGTGTLKMMFDTCTSGRKPPCKCQPDGGPVRGMQPESSSDRRMCALLCVWVTERRGALCSARLGSVQGAGDGRSPRC